jgi:hypothetical protein
VVPLRQLPTCCLFSSSPFGIRRTRVFSYSLTVPQSGLPSTLASSLFRSLALLLSFILYYWSGLLSALAAKGTLFSVHSFNCVHTGSFCHHTYSSSRTALSTSHILLTGRPSLSSTLHCKSFTRPDSPLRQTAAYPTAMSSPYARRCAGWCSCSRTA